MRLKFQSTSSIQRKTCPVSLLPLGEVFQSTSSIQRKTNNLSGREGEWVISIHFLYTEEDIERFNNFGEPETFQSTSSIQRKTTFKSIIETERCISIHFLYTEEDTRLPAAPFPHQHFNPLPLYRGRLGRKRYLSFQIHFNPLPLYRGRPGLPI